MYFDIFLISVIIVTTYLGPVILRRHPPGHRTYGWLLIADGICACIALAGRGADAGGADLLGFVALGAALFLVVIPPFLRSLARWALLSDRLRLARRLVDIRELLQPGMGAASERELIDAVIAVRSGQVDEAVDGLRETRERTSAPLARQRIDERIVLTYLSARRWQDAIDAYEVAFTDQPPLPHFWVEMVRAYCEVGQLAAAADLLENIEALPIAEEPFLLLRINQARLVFLAFVGRTHAVESIVAPTGPLGMLPPASRHFWAGIARLRAGDRSGARSSLERAAQLSRRDRRRRQVAENIIESIDVPGVAGPHTMAPEVAELADRLAAETAKERVQPVKMAPQLSGVAWRRIPTTVGLVVANLVIFTLVMWLYGSTGDPGGLVLSGANVKSAVMVGEWWRLASSMFVHVGFVHLLLNMYALWILGKLVEQIYGSPRMFGLYTVSGLVGSIASVVFGGLGLSAGASGAVLGLLGALIAELGLNREAYPERWRKLLFGNLVFVAVAQVAIGFFYTAIDQSAHLGGLLAGAFLAALISPRSAAGASAAVRVLVAALVGFAAAALVYGAVGVATTDYRDTLARYGQVEHRVGGLAFVGPANWRIAEEGILYDVEVLQLGVGIDKLGDGGVSEILGDIVDDETRLYGARRRPEHLKLRLPDPWQSRELDVVQDGMGGKQRWRIIVFGRESGAEAWLGSMRVPAALAPDVQPTLERLLSTMRRP